MHQGNVLLVEDEQAISGPLAAALEREGFGVRVAATGVDGMDAASGGGVDLVLLDLMLPDMDGRDLCRSLRARSQVPIIMLTARGLETDRVVGLELGADDYIVKPFSVAELVARMRAVLRRAGPAGGPSTPETVTLGGIVLDARTWTVTREGERVDLTRREFELLRLLMSHPGTVLTRDQLMEQVWDPNWFGPTKTLDVHISGLRRKLGDDSAHPRYIHTVRGVGFRFSAAQDL